MSVRTLQVDLGARGYPVHIGPGLLHRAEFLRPLLPGGRLLAVTNETVAPLYLDAVRAGIGRDDLETLVLPDGEAHKTLESFTRVLDRLAGGGVTRDGGIVALGGGVISDIAGFAAACYMRGIAFVNCPTTLLAQVDASVGGKTGINHRLGKNLIGAFHQPAGVIADTDTLATLPAREYRAGLAEVVKTALLADAAFFEWLESSSGAILEQDPDILSSAIERSCRIKAAVVAEDERELGRRALLNLGHTFAHAIESESGYERFLHGEAVAMGLAQAARLSRLQGRIPAEAVDRLDRLLGEFGLPTALPEDMDPGRLLARMRLDKKARAGRTRFVLLESIGRAVVIEDVPEERVLAALAPGG